MRFNRANEKRLHYAHPTKPSHDGFFLVIDPSQNKKPKSIAIKQ